MLKEWIERNKLNVNWIDDKVFEIDSKTFFVLEPNNEGNIVDSELNLTLTKKHIKLFLSGEYHAVAFNFGGNWYYTTIDESKLLNNNGVKAKFNFLKYIGQAKQDFDFKNWAHLGIHSEYEILNGSRDFSQWVKKAKFLGLKGLGLVDKNTLSGTLAFQMECIKNGLEFIIGMTIDIMFDEEIKYEGIVYALTDEGWRNLLHINTEINIKNEQFIREDDLLKYGNDVCFIFSKDSFINDKRSNIREIKNKIKKYKKHFSFVYYQIDSVEFYSAEFDNAHLNSIKRYLNEYSDIIDPILINDSYYLDQEEYKLKQYINKVSRVALKTSVDQYFKSLDDTLEKFEYLFDENKLFKNQKNFYEILIESIENTKKLIDRCSFQINTGEHKLPTFEYDGDNVELFFELLEKGLKQRGIKSKEYIERLETECTIIVQAGFVDYFLILWDIIEWCKTEDIMIGTGRGSVVGSLVAYLLNITNVDPLKYDLLFERFMNKTRVSGERAKSPDALPDVDIDFEAERREDVKEYVRKKYGDDYVCNIGTYTRLKPKGVIKDFGRVDGLKFQFTNWITSKIPDQIDYEFEDLFLAAQKSKPLKDFIQNNPELINNMKIALNQPKAESIHASAIIIVPKTDKQGNKKDIFDWMPLRKVRDEKLGKDVLVSEWEGKYIDRAGFLKEDILSLRQLDIFQNIIRLIFKHRGEKINLLDIPEDDPKTLKLFQKGYTEGAFQYHTYGMKSYCRKVLPDRLEDLICMNALYRPGPMRSNAHVDYALIKKGKKKKEIDFGLESVTDKTHGLYIFQEQIMKAVNVLGNLSLVDADNIRTAMKKFDSKKLKSYRKEFIKGAIQNGCPAKEAENIWDKLERFSGYGFNRSHSAAYSIMGYWCNYLKAHYPLEFWTTLIQYSRSENMVANFISEMSKAFKNISLELPNINESQGNFTANPRTQTIYWSLLKVKHIGNKTVKKILKVRESAKFSDLNDFIDRMEGTGVGKGETEYLILSGAFDKLEKIKKPLQRRELIKRLYEIKNYKFEDVEEYNSLVAKTKDYHWILIQKELIGYGSVDFQKVIAPHNKIIARFFVSGTELPFVRDNKVVAIAGLIIQLIERQSKRGPWASMTLLSNNDIVFALVWNDTWHVFKDQLQSIKKQKKLVAITGRVKYDTWRNEKVINTFDKTKIIEL